MIDNVGDYTHSKDSQLILSWSEIVTKPTAAVVRGTGGREHGAGCGRQFVCKINDFSVQNNSVSYRRSWSANSLHILSFQIQLKPLGWWTCNSTRNLDLPMMSCGTIRVHDTTPDMSHREYYWHTNEKYLSRTLRHGYAKLLVPPGNLQRLIDSITFFGDPSITYAVHRFLREIAESAKTPKKI